MSSTFVTDGMVAVGHVLLKLLLPRGGGGASDGCFKTDKDASSSPLTSSDRKGNLGTFPPNAPRPWSHLVGAGASVLRPRRRRRCKAENESRGEHTGADKDRHPAENLFKSTHQWLRMSPA